jgi:hypothetical protein
MPFERIKESKYPEPGKNIQGERKVEVLYG